MKEKIKRTDFDAAVNLREAGEVSGSSLDSGQKSSKNL